MNEITLYQPEVLNGKLLGYAAKFDVLRCKRKRISSYGLWYVSIKQGRHYPKLPQGFGAVGSESELMPAVQHFIGGAGIDWQYVRRDGLVSWKLIKLLIVQRDFNPMRYELSECQRFGI
jgi:hypothetical protein